MRIPRKTLIAVGAGAAIAAGGTGVALAVSGGDDGRPVSAADAEKAKAAALKATGGGTVTEFERDDEQGAVYEVEVTAPDGSSVDVRLDDRFALVGQPEVDDDRGEADDDRGDRERDDD